jgi:2-oxoglutarate ferredoxin oxidoreductase subunit alpha
MFDYTIKAFNLSEKYRVPVLVMADEVVGHMTEKVVIPDAKDIETVNRKKPRTKPENYVMYQPDEDLVPPMANAGDGYKVITTGLTHNEKGYPDMSQEAQEKLIKRLCDKIIQNKKDIIEIEERFLEDATIAVVAYGSPARSALRAVKNARNEKIPAGLMRLITVWPFPEEEVFELAKKVETIIVPEINNGQMVREVDRCSKGQCNIIPVPAYARIHEPEEILTIIKENLS